MHAKWQS